MRLLVLSMLRFGDLLQHMHLAENLVNKGHQVDLLVNDECRQVEELFPDYRFHFFPRKMLQSLLIDESCHPLSAMIELQNFVSHLNQLGYQEVQNWTHDFLSARIMDLLQIHSKRGAMSEAGVLLNSPGAAFRYLNETWGPSAAPAFQWTDILAKAFDLGRVEVPRVDSHRTGPVVLQVLTSDQKKNWPLTQWRELAARILSQGHEVVIPCAPFETSQVMSQSWPEGVRIESCRFLDLKKYLEKAALLVACDTSVVHLAAWTRTPTLALYLGSADPFKTAPRLSGARILASEVPCAPCRHRDPCGQARHECAERISVQAVMSEVESILHLSPKILNTRQVRRFQMKEASTGELVLVDGLNDLSHLWSQAVWEIYFNGDQHLDVPPYGSTAAQLLLQIKRVSSVEVFVAHMKLRLNDSFHLIHEIANQSLFQLRSLDFKNDSGVMNNEDELARMMVQLVNMWDRSDFVRRLEETVFTENPQSFRNQKNRKAALEEVSELFLIQKALLKALELECQEWGENHGART